MKLGMTGMSGYRQSERKYQRPGCRSEPASAKPAQGVVRSQVVDDVACQVPDLEGCIGFCGKKSGGDVDRRRSDKILAEPHYIWKWIKKLRVGNGGCIFSPQ